MRLRLTRGAGEPTTIERASERAETPTAGILDKAQGRAESGLCGYQNNDDNNKAGVALCRLRGCKNIHFRNKVVEAEGAATTTLLVFIWRLSRPNVFVPSRVVADSPPQLIQH